MNKVKIFISYAKDDFNIMKGVEYVCKELKSIDYNKKKYEIEVWSDQYIIGGENWKETIIERIKDADVILFLISSRFIKSDFIRTVEIPLALERRQEAKIGILGIYMEECDYSQIDMRKTQIVPQYQGRLKPVVLWSRQEGCWEAIRDGIEKCAYLSIDRLPWHNKSTKQTLPATLQEKDFEHNAPVEYQYLRNWGLMKEREKEAIKQAKRRQIEHENNEDILKAVAVLLILVAVFITIYKLI